MKISRGMLNHYIGYVTDWYISDHNVPADKLSEYHYYVLKIKEQAIKHEDLEPLRLGINYLLCHSEIDLENHGGMYPWDDDEVREILMYIRSVIWRNAFEINCKEVKDINLTNTTDIDWWKKRGVKP